MWRKMIYAAILVSLLLVPVEQMDASQLIPVQVVAVYRQDGLTVIETDTQNKGMGETPEAALQNLKATAKGTIYLDTAQYLLLTEDGQEAVQVLRSHLKPSVKMCGMEAPLSLEQVAQYLDIHSRLPKLRSWKRGTQLPVLRAAGDSYLF